MNKGVDMMCLRASFLAIVLCGSLNAETIEVPGDFADLQMGIEAASPGDVIIVHGGEWDPILIDKPLSILGDPAPFIRRLETDFSGGKPLIRLQGPGAGRVVLANITTGGVNNGAFVASMGAAIGGGGFDSLHVHRSLIQPPQWQFVNGQALGAAGIDTSVPVIWVTETQVEGADSDYFDLIPGLQLEGGAGIEAPSSTVLLLDSSVTGGNGTPVELLLTGCDLSQASGGSGGAGLVADRLFRSLSAISGGEGGAIDCGPFDLGQMPSGVDVIVNEEVQLVPSIQSLGEVSVGSPWSLEMVSAGLLLIGTKQIPPTPFVASEPPAMGWLFLDLSSVLVVDSVGGTETYNVPNAAALVGLELIAQYWDGSSFLLSRPVAKVVLP